MEPKVAIVGMACRYPEAATPAELWDNVLAKRRAFRRLPAVRLPSADYVSSRSDAVDLTYANEAAVIDGYEFDRIRYQVPVSTFKQVDMAHWLALDIAAQALADAGFDGSRDLPRQTTGVIVGNTLTGEFSRTTLMRLRWPYVRRVVDSKLTNYGWEVNERSRFLHELEEAYKEPFVPMGTDSLAGARSNTIAGRICNPFDLKGGGYTGDGACAASLLAVITACNSLASGDLDVALAGGVDLSLDPLELVGFARIGALSRSDMRVYDRRSDGFWPGEGCGFVVLTRLADARALGCRVYAVIRGWGVSSDGSGGITRPELDGQVLALNRAYARAGYGIETVGYFEGHGTGTSVGDTTELRALSQMRRQARTVAPTPAVIGSIKANIGHTKAAAGVAGLIKATMALHRQILPPTTGCDQPHEALASADPGIRVVNYATAWPAEQPLRASVSAMGFGGINTHVAVEAPPAPRRRLLGSRERILAASEQDAELFLLGAGSLGQMQDLTDQLLTVAPGLSRSELTDLAAELVRRLQPGRIRAAVVAASPAQLGDALRSLRSRLNRLDTPQLDAADGVFVAVADHEPRIGFLFTGQGSPAYLDGGLLCRRFRVASEVYRQAALPLDADGRDTAVAQPAVVTASAAGLAALRWLGIHGSAAVGHSLGELTALHWAGAFGRRELIETARERGRLMAELGDPEGAMVSVAAAPPEIEAMIQQVESASVVIAAFNAPNQTVISGKAQGIAHLVDLARARGLRATGLRVSRAFHSPLVAAAEPARRAYLKTISIRGLRGTVYSTVTGGRLSRDCDLRELLSRQVTGPVRFFAAVSALANGADLLLEVGPGNSLIDLVRRSLETPAMSLDAGGASLQPFLRAVAAAFALGAPLQAERLFEGRFSRSFSLDRERKYFVNPCEFASSAIPDEVVQGREPDEPKDSMPPTASAGVEQRHVNAADLLLQLVAERTELPNSSITRDTRFLSDLHLNSITVSEIVTQAAKTLGLPIPAALTDYANATISEAATALEQAGNLGYLSSSSMEERFPTGLEAWVRPFVSCLRERAAEPLNPPQTVGQWRLVAPSGHPLQQALERGLPQLGGGGVVLCLPRQPGESDLGLFLTATRLVDDVSASCLVVVQEGGGGSAFARSFFLEHPESRVRVVDLPFEHPDAASWVMGEAVSGARFSEAVFDGSGGRQEPVLEAVSIGYSDELPLSHGDVLLVSGGGKGIGAECGLSLAVQSGCRLGLLGRSLPEADAELRQNLARIAGSGVKFIYVSADVTSAASVRAAVSTVEADLGRVTAILHAAGVNEPRLLSDMDEKTLLGTVAPKVRGADNLLGAVDTSRLRLFAAFGSVIARTGLRGEAHYAIANEWLTRRVERHQREYPTCRCLVLEWSVWSGIGMGDRLGRVDALKAQGISPIAPEHGVRMLARLLGAPIASVGVVVSGRLGTPPTVRFADQPLPLLRFLERSIVHYPGVELIAEADVSRSTDLYLDDHVLRGQRILPGVVGLEAMAQAARALGGDLPSAIEEVTFNRALVVPEEGAVRVRLVALTQAPGLVDVAIRAEPTGFQVDHMRAVFRLGTPASLAVQSETPLASELVPINPSTDLYGPLLFHGSRFRRVVGYRKLRATECVAELSAADDGGWFGWHLPPDLVLGDPGLRDAAIHAVQACVPDMTLLPVSVERIDLGGPGLTGPATVHAQERARVGNEFVYDLSIASRDGSVLERWHSLRLRAVTGSEAYGPWCDYILNAYLERRLAELLPGQAIDVVLGRNGHDRASTDQLIRAALPGSVTLWRRPDGKPMPAGPIHVSATHAGDLAVAVASTIVVGCDAEGVRDRPEASWIDLVGDEGFSLAHLISGEIDEPISTAATRVWTALECMRKLGQIGRASPLVLESASAGGVVIASGRGRVATIRLRINGHHEFDVLAVMVEDSDARV